MESLLEVIFGNAAVLFLVIGAIVSFFNKKSTVDEKSKETQTKQKQPKKTEEIDWKQIFRHEENTPTEHTEKEVLSFDQPHEVSSPNEYMKKYEEVKQKNSRSKVVDSRSPIYKDDVTRSKPDLEIDFSNISKHDAMKGVIWAEVLGRPRAQNRHRSFANQRLKKG